MASPFTLRDDVVDYGIVPSTFNSMCLEPNQILDNPDQNFAREGNGMRVVSHMVFSTPVNTFTLGTNPPCYYPPPKDNNTSARSDLSICLWQLFGRTAYHTLQNNLIFAGQEDEQELSLIHI